MDLKGYLRSIRWLGLRASLEAVRVAWRRDRLDRTFDRTPVGSRQRIGDLSHHTFDDDVTRLEFGQVHLEIQFLAPDAVRVCWQPGIEPPPYGIATAAWDQTSVERQVDSKGIRLRTPAMQVRVSPGGELSFMNANGQLLRRDLPPLRHGEGWTSRSPLQPEAVISGLGERAAGLNLRPGSYRLWNSDPAGSYERGLDPLYLSIPAYVVLQPQGSYLISYENPHDGSLSLGERADISFVAGQLRYLLIAGVPPTAIARWQSLIGRPAMPPRWALGYHQSRWGYMNEDDLRAVIDGFAEHDLPLSAIHLDIDYMRGYRVFTVDPNRFPSLPTLAKELDEKLGARLVAILDPGVKIERAYSIYLEGLDGDHFVKLPNGRPFRGAVWPGAVHFPDFTDPEARRWWGTHYRELMDMGIAGFWHDMNEPTTFTAWGDTALPLPVRHSFEGAGGDHRTGHNVYGAAMNMAGYQAMRSERPATRPWLLSRSGWTGSARHAWNWTGDTASTWDVLRLTVPTVLGLGLSGIPFTGPDIGGFSGEPSAELFVRWFELAAFMPFFRTHSSKTSPPREPWRFGPQALAICRKYLQLRQALMPYLYTLAAESHHTGWPLVRPLYWLQPSEASLWTVEDAFLLGDHLLVAPVLEQSAVSRPVPLPAGRWFDFWNGQVHDGPAKPQVTADLDHVPLYVRAGAVLPMAEDDGLTLHLYPPSGGQIVSTLYSDAGDGYGPSRWDTFEVAGETDSFSLEWSTEGDYPSPWPRITLALHGSDRWEAQIDGQRRPVVDGRLSVRPFTQATFRPIEGSR